MNDLQIPPKSYNIGISRQNISIVPFIDISFDDIGTVIKTDVADNPVYLHIIFETPVLTANAGEVRKASNNKNGWGVAEQTFYSKQIVGDIK